MLSKYGSDTDEADDDYLCKEGWVAGPNTTLEGLPQAQPYGYDAALIPGFIRKVYVNNQEKWIEEKAGLTGQVWS